MVSLLGQVEGGSPTGLTERLGRGADGGRSRHKALRLSKKKVGIVAKAIQVQQT